MSRNKNLNVAVLAASIALAMTTTSALASTPSATQLPGKGKVVSGSVDLANATISNGQQSIGIVGNAVIDWGSGSDLNASGTGGFNIGSGAHLSFNDESEGSAAVLNIDSSGNASQIFGALDGGKCGCTSVFVANKNGVIVGSGAQISGNVSLIANKLSDSAASDFQSNPASLAYDGAGGDVTVQKGAMLDGTILLSAGGNVNVDLSAITGGTATLAAGLPSTTAGSFASTNTGAAINATGALGGGSLAGFSSAGTASNAGILDLTSVGTYSVGGLFTNTGDLTLPGANGAVHNIGKLTTHAGGSFSGGLTNDGSYDVGFGSGLTSVGSDLVNNGTITNAGNVTAVDGSITNKGSISDVAAVSTVSDTNYKAGADYSITNSGLISASGGSLTFEANSERASDPGNDTTGSITNTGALQLAATEGDLQVIAYNDLSWGGTLKIGGQAISPTNEPDYYVMAGLNGTATLSTPAYASEVAELIGAKVKVLADMASPEVALIGGAKVDGDYAVRVGSGATVTGDTVIVAGANLVLDEGLTPADANVMIQGTVAGNQVFFGYGEAGLSVSDVVAGPAGSIQATGLNPMVEFDFTGKIKTAPYLNDANFRYNDLPITVTDDKAVTLILNPLAYQTNATADSAVNILVNGGVTLESGLSTPDAALQSSSVTGVNSWGNTHLVLQSTGSIAVTGMGGEGDFYWPGMVYLGTIGTNADGSAAPGTLGYGSIALNGNFNNVLPGDVAGGAGIHFITQYPLQMNGNSVITNANSWINFGSDALTAAYASGTQGGGLFFAGAQGSGNVVNYGDLDPSMFHTQAPSSIK